MLESYKPFCQLSEAGKQWLREGAQTVRCAAEMPVLHKGQPVSGAYFVLSGRLRVLTLAPNGTEATLYFIDPGETCVFALNSLFNDLRYPAWVRSEVDTDVAVIPGPLFRRLFASEATMRDLTVNALSTLVFRLMDELENVHSYKLRQRLANLLLTHAGNDGVLRMTQQQMADHLGTTREVVARLVQEFVGAGQVRSGRGQVALLDAAGLAAVISGESS
jgi:CRP/FNR family transcriptional regulator